MEYVRFLTARMAAGRVLRARGQRHLLLLLDFDGTLCELAPEPQLVRLPANVAEALRALATAELVTLGFISGRRAADLRRHLPPLSGVYVAGCHGLEIEAPGGEVVCAAHAAGAAAAQEVAAAIAPELPAWPGTFVEDKQLSVALHVRNASPSDGARAAARLRELAAGAVADGRLRILDGAAVTELLPAADANKGRALDRIRQHVMARVGPVFTVFAGDDVTDEDAFRALGHSGLGIAVGARVVGAECRLDGPASTGRLLEILVDSLTQVARRNG
jgi:trehalose-phosphatase